MKCLGPPPGDPLLPGRFYLLKISPLFRAVPPSARNKVSNT